MLTERAECTLTEAFLRRRVESAEPASYGPFQRDCNKCR